MNDLQLLNSQFALSKKVASDGIDIFRISDPLGNQINIETQRHVKYFGELGPGVWDPFLAAIRHLRWRLQSTPRSGSTSAALLDSCNEVLLQLNQLIPQVPEEAGLAGTRDAVEELKVKNREIEAIVGDYAQSRAARQVVILCQSASSMDAITGLINSQNMELSIFRDLRRGKRTVDEVIALGPPRFFPPSLVEAPIAPKISFFVPNWFQDLRVPAGVLTPYAEGRIAVKGNEHHVGDSEAVESTTEQIDEADLMPTPMWDMTISPKWREEGDLVPARKVLLAGHKAIWLDQGERIRCVDTESSKGEQVSYIDIDLVAPGTYLLLRSGETERSLIFDMALNQLGNQVETVQASQERWKNSLRQRFLERGDGTVESELLALGCRASGRAVAWTDPYLIRPNLDRDFHILLNYLQVPDETEVVSNANMLRRSIYGVSTTIRKELEALVADADLGALLTNGFLHLTHENEAIRGLLATRVLAISSEVVNVPRMETRIPFDDGGGRWLE